MLDTKSLEYSSYSVLTNIPCEHGEVKSLLKPLVGWREEAPKPQRTSSAADGTSKAKLRFCTLPFISTQGLCSEA